MANLVESPGPDRIFVFQEFDQLLPWKTVKNNIVFAPHREPTIRLEKTLKTALAVYRKGQSLESLRTAIRIRCRAE
jgi:NitT/TauT family transport system ATP-binding protein